LHGGTEPPDNGEMLARIEKLENEMIRVEHSLKAEIHKVVNEQTWKIITWTTGLGAALVAITFFLARTVH
jgi:hypothetical protein